MKKNHLITDEGLQLIENVTELNLEKNTFITLNGI